MQPGIHIHTFGCKLNYAESSTYARQLLALGAKMLPTVGGADVLLVNSCAVTDQAQRKIRQYVRRARRERPGLFVAMVGCYANLQAECLLGDGTIDCVVPRDERAHLGHVVLSSYEHHRKGQVIPSPEPGSPPQFFHAFSKGGRTRAFLKVQDGCGYRCTYCTIPLARGHSVSPPIAELVREAERIAANGMREIVLTGVNTGDFGRQHGEDFLDLLQALDRVPGIARYRISSIEPNLLSDRILDFMAGSAHFLPHLHVPLQSGSDAVLRRMGRRYTASRYVARIEAARRALGDPFIGVDVIVGFPGETDEDFRRTEDLLRDVSPSALHVFPFSPRPGTPAASMPGGIPQRVIHERVERLLELSRDLLESYCARHILSVRPVLVERILRDGLAQGFTDNYIKVFFPPQTASRGDIVEVRLDEFSNSQFMKGSIAYAT